MSRHKAREVRHESTPEERAPIERDSLALWARRLRVPLGILLAGLFLVLARPSWTALAIGGAVSFSGLLIRGWSAGHIVKNDRLATGGPYAYTRNPLYFGSFVLAFGLAAAAHWAFGLAVISFWWIVYGPVIADERKSIRSLFPHSYPEWERNVPAFLPRLTPWRPKGAETSSFSLERYLGHKEWQAALGYAAVVGWLALRASGQF
ncbi:MAG: isoprenylcysteine carboxylmethyltransferase family protein [Gemmatimonadetes bacterium]|nr:isoprenylcysteine carboxylmethyltransferase family protein [Gemmatimonadota bacterium]